MPSPHDTDRTGRLPGGEVHVWSADVDEVEPAPSRALLSPDELGRARKFRSTRDRDRWVAGRALLRRVLAGYLARDPRDIRFQLGKNDKPELAGVDGGPRIHFSLSHSGTRVLIAVADAPVGVDVERIRELPDLPGVARHALRPEELDALEDLPADRRTEAFIAVWTRKEAYLKARARGIGEIRDVRVDVDPDTATLIGDDEDPDASTRYRLHDVEAGTGYRAAVAVRGRPVVVHRSIGGLTAGRDQP